MFHDLFCKFYINNVRIVSRKISVSNGVIMIVDAVVIP